MNEGILAYVALVCYCLAREKPLSICCYCSLTLFSCLEKEQQEAIEHIDEVQNEIDRYVELY